MSLSFYPPVAGEVATVAKLREGYSIARFGDGEFKIAFGVAQMREPANKKLAKELRTLLRSPPPRCIVGVPTMDPAGPKYKPFWSRHEVRFSKALSGNVQYYSSLITRPDSAPWIESAGFVESLVKVWRGKRVALVAEADTSIVRAVERTAGEHALLICPHRETSRVMPRLLERVYNYDPDVVLLSCGPAATAMAARLSADYQAVDIGSAGQFILRHLA